MCHGITVFTFTGVLLISSLFCDVSASRERNSTRFSLELYKSFFDESNNAIISPISIRLILAILYQSVVNGTITEEQLRNVLHYPTDKIEARNHDLYSIHEIFEDPSLSVFNKIYLKQDFRLLSNFNETVSGYRAAVEQVDFSKSKETADKINSWAKEQTKGLIRKLVSQDIITNDLAVLLINTLHFKADWEDPFDLELVQGPFYNGNKTYNVSYMKNEDAEIGYGVVNEINADVIQVFYTDGSNYTFWIILPHENSNISDVKNLLSVTQLDLIRSRIVERDPYELWMPAFDIENIIDGNRHLIRMGLDALFVCNDLEMIEESKLKVNEIKQKVKITVNTKGTEAAAASSIIQFHI